jgi:hypothetical protein
MEEEKHYIRPSRFAENCYIHPNRFAIKWRKKIIFIEPSRVPLCKSCVINLEGCVPMYSLNEREMHDEITQSNV